MWSYWEQQSFIGTPDIAIIGSGIVGLSTAIEFKLRKPGYHVMIIERGMLPYGASTRNAGFACYGSISELLSDLESTSFDEVMHLVERRWKGLLKLRSRLSDEKIGLEKLGGYEVFSPSDESLYEECANAIERFNYSVGEITGIKEVYRISSDKIKNFGLGNCSHLIENTGEAQIDTGKMMKSLLALAHELGVETLNGADVEKIESSEHGATIFVKGAGKIRTGNLILTTNGFAKLLYPNLEVEPARAQVLITKPIEGLSLRGTFHYDEGYYYFRNVGNRVLFGGGRNLDFRAENTMDFSLTSLVQTKLDDLLSSMIIPGIKYEIDQRWAGIMGVGPVKKPIVEKLDNHIYCAVRMGGMGVALGSLVGEEVCRLVLG
ncbi:MAG: FAD-dependent oxidoreductase [Bacteroidia bacterium]